MNLRQVETFAAVMKCGTASRAAEILGISQPAVSRSIAELERSVGFSLFARVRNRLVATPEADLLFGEINAAFRGLDAIRSAASQIRDHGSGEIRVGSLLPASQSVMPKAIAAFGSRYPDARVSLSVLPSRDIRNLVAAGRLDLGLTTDYVDVAGVIHQPFIVREALCIVPKSHALSSNAVITPADIHGTPFITYSPEDRFRQRYDAVFAKAGASPKVVVETPSATIAVALVSQGVGLALASPHAIGNADRSQFLAKPFQPSIAVRVLLLLPPDRPKSRLVTEFIDALLKAR